jgi:hypothetical protein
VVSTESFDLSIEIRNIPESGFSANLIFGINSQLIVYPKCKWTFDILLNFVAVHFKNRYLNCKRTHEILQLFNIFEEGK